MSNIWYLYPIDQDTYLRVLHELTPILDREGLSFHVARPSAPTSAPCRTAKSSVKLMHTAHMEEMKDTFCTTAESPRKR